MQKLVNYGKPGMKIGIFDPYLDDLGGGEKYMLSIAQCLSKHHDVSIFWDNEKDLQLLSQRFFNGKDIKREKNIFSPKVSLFKRLLETKKYDCIFFLSDGSIPFSLSRKLFIHIQQPLHNSQTESLGGKMKLLRVAKVFYNSFYTESFNSSLFSKSKTVVIYPPVDLFSKKTTKENIILHVGRFRVRNVGVTDYKKQAIMIGTFKKMVDQGLKNWKFTLAVSVLEKDLKTFEEMKKSTKGYPIQFFINKTNEELWDLYSKAKIYWHASGFGEDLKAHPEYAEHFGISTVEAMGGGVVPVVINVGGQTEIVQEGESGFLWNDQEEFIQKTKKLIENQKLWEKMSKSASLRAKDFGKEEFCRKIKYLLVS